ncbi:MAG: TolC family protein [Saprospiraceae bacterium]|nr:TolC family protein [Saprospiraceae bacterium]
MKYSKFLLFISLLVTMQSCFVAKKYTRPDNVLTQESFRGDVRSIDTTDFARISWKQIFTDSLLTDYINQGLANNIDVRIALQNIEEAQAYVRQAQAAYYPSLNVGPAYSFASPSLNTQGLDNRLYLNQFDLSANLSWEADIWGKIKSSDKASRAAFLQTVAAQQAVKSRLIAAIASGYYQLLALDQQKRITEETVGNRKKSFETISALKEAGNVNEVAVRQDNALRLNAQALLIDIENNIHMMENAFCILLGESPHDVPRTTLEQQKPDSLMTAGVPLRLLTNRPDVLAAEYGLINAFELTNVARSNFYPSLRITANGGFQSLDFANWFSPASIFGTVVGSLTQPVFNQRQIRSQLEIRKAQQEKAFLNYKATILDATREVSDALYTYQAMSSKISLKRQEYLSYEKAVSYSEELIKNGLGTYLDVLTSRQNMLNAQLNLVNTEYSRLNSIVQLYQAIGGGWQ